MRGFVTEEESPLRQLELIDPALATSVIAVLAEKQGRFSLKDLSLLADETLWAFSLDIMFGEIVAAGYARLIGEVPTERLLRYRDETRKAGSYGLNLGRMMADYLVPVLHHGSDAFGEQFLALVRTLRGRGEYIMKKPLSLLSVFLNAGAQEAAWEFLRLLGDAYAGDIPYKRGLRLAHLLPKAIQGFSPSRRCWQMVQIRRILRADTALADPFMAAMDKGLGLLSEAALGDFISLGLEKFGRNPEMGTRFLALASESGLNAWSDRMVTVPLTQVREPLRRYLRARTGRTIAIRPLSAIPKTFFPDGAERPLVCSDGQAIYLPDEIGLAERREENSALYKCLTRLESAHYEFGTFEFDSERAARQYGVPLPGEGPENRSDLERFFQSFPRPALAADLFAVFEQGRIRLRMAETYPGMVRQTFPVLIREMGVMSEFSFPERLYCRIGLGAAPDDDPPFVRELADRFEMAVAADARVETCAGLVFGCYSEAERHFCTPGETPYRPLQIPFGRRVRPDLFLAGFQHFDKMAGQVRVRLAEKGLKAYKSDIRKQLIDNSGTLSPADLKEIVFSRDNGTPGESRGRRSTSPGLICRNSRGSPGRIRGRRTQPARRSSGTGSGT
ncbi:VWA domain-containing protein [Desulfonema ishimotonii]|uniref:VWA domain-containing protein n=1 Tax=Desulfonema ishimotonii TaxID=45657 RepID=A0A401G3Z2_9BACT|nr:hypothetical protein [Desulfonema ishimotonii]GBC63950.1 VWA domain-containing protein [Desulfonema ishimotonii]